MRVIVAGGRDVTDYALVEAAIEASGFQITEVVSGGARGADTFGEEWARRHGIPFVRFPAEWHKYGRSAGVLRNQQMAAYADALVAVPTGGPGTRNMILEAQRARIPIYVPHL